MIWIGRNTDEILALTWAHLLITVPAIVAATIIALPIGWFANRHRRVGGVILSISGLLYTIPALPMLIMLPLILSIPLRSQTNLIATLTLYGVALLASPGADAFGSVSATTRDSATAQGYSPRQLFWKVDLPLALPVYLSATRVMTMSTVGLATIGSLVGIPSLGNLLTDGFQRGIIEEVASGIVMTVVLAVGLDLLLRLLQWWLLPWQRSRGRSPSPSASPTQRTSEPAKAAA